MKLIKKEVKVSKYIIELNEAEAHFLKALCGCQIGSMTKSYREIADRFYDVLGDDFDQSWLNHISRQMYPELVAVERGHKMKICWKDGVYKEDD